MVLRHGNERLFGHAGMQRRIASIGRGGGQFRQQIRTDSKQVASCQRHDLRGISETCTHDFGADAVLFVIPVNVPHGLHAWIAGALVRLFAPQTAGLFFVPVVNTAHER